MVPDGPQTFPFPQFHVLYSDEHKRADGCELRDPYLVRCWQRVYLGHLLTLDIGHFYIGSCIAITGLFPATTR